MKKILIAIIITLTLTSCYNKVENNEKKVDIEKKVLIKNNIKKELDSEGTEKIIKEYELYCSKKIEDIEKDYKEKIEKIEKDSNNYFDEEIKKIRDESNKIRIEEIERIGKESEDFNKREMEKVIESLKK